MEKTVLTHVENQLGFITLNRPEKRNALSPQLIGELSEAFAQMKADKSVKLVILQAKGKAFCAGADLEYLQELQQFSYEENLEDSHRLKRLFSQIYEFPKVVIAKVQGHALAGGCGLVTVCDFAFADSEALFGYTEAKIGFVPALVSVFLAEQIGHYRAGELLISGEMISAKKADEFGLITGYMDGASLDHWVLNEFALKLIRDNSAFSMGETKRLLRSLGKVTRDQALDAAAEANARARAHEDCKKGIAAFLQKTKPTW
ncbi:methylglutaconyl-CoA hydratase [Algoriphagus aquaeductus]|uniref:Methylglutaconyl-CoA hydratase n=1 Tax=Algoriphagus aquaeductus TaxID=475299 RepID=A0A326RW69_9BACT|nr:enoyl-CoA hydratase-related protein [Algoriphagus aquaeductus]PZV84634.1 methylglutaconyl-CoA hydratase [Algoriphagus aquaeductus]